MVKVLNSVGALGLLFLLLTGNFPTSAQTHSNLRKVTSGRSLFFDWFRGPAGPTGPEGPAGPQGPQGAPGATNVLIRPNFIGTCGRSTCRVTGSCNPGETITGVGYSFSDTRAWAYISGPSRIADDGRVTEWSLVSRRVDITDDRPYSSTLWLLCASP